MQLEVTAEINACQPPEAQMIIRVLPAKLRGLEAQRSKMPQNTSLPPSSQHPHAKPQGDARDRKRRRGGQPGHPKQSRPLLFPAQCDVVVPIKPTECRCCGQALSGENATPLRHQIWELL